MAAPMRILRLSEISNKMSLYSRLQSFTCIARPYICRTLASTSFCMQSTTPVNKSELPTTDTNSDNAVAMDNDEPVEMDDPYTKPHKKCIICQYNIEPDYKNVQLLSQFVSPFTGRIYGRHITGLCTPMQRRISSLIKTAQKNGFMPYLFKETVFLKDPKLYDPFARITHVPDQDKESPKYKTFFERVKS